MFNVITYNVSGLMGSWPPRFVHTVRTGRRYPWSPASCRASMTGAGRIAEEHHLVDRDGIFTCPSRRLVDSRHRPMLAPVRRNRNTHRRRATFPWLHASSSGPLSVARRAADSCSQLPIAVGCIRRNIPRGGGNHPYPHGSSRSSSSRRRSPGSHFTGSDRGQGATMCRAGVLEGFSGVSNLMAPEFATVFSAVIAITSVSINLYGGLLTEKRRADLAREVERERQAMAAQDEERSVVARYRGPLLEATVDLEARLYHIATLTGEWRSGDVVCEEEVVYTLFTLAQWLGFLEVIRREGPRERSFLQRGGGSAAAAGGGGGGGGGGGVSTGGADTLTTLVEGFRFVLSAHPATLRKWYEQGDGREHPGCRSRAMMLRGTPALPDDWLGAEGNGRGVWRERPPPPQLTTGGQQSGAIPAGLRLLSGGGGSGGSATASYGRGPGGGAPQPPWSSGGRHGTVPPPTKPVVLRHRSGLGPVSGGPGAVTGPAGGSELLIGSLDEHDLAAAGLGLPDLDTGYDLGQFMTPGRSGAATIAIQPSPSPSASNGLAAAAAAAATVASADLFVGGLGSFTTLSSLSSLSSFDEGSLPTSSSAAAAINGGGGGGAIVRRSAPRDVFHISRGVQRSIGSMMVVTPMGASRHYTLSYGDFYNRYYRDDFFGSWLRPVHTDILALVGGRMWQGQGPFPMNRWTRLLLLQQLLVETIDLLDPAHVRVPANRRVVLAPVSYKQAPELETYRARMTDMSQLDSPLLMQHLQNSQANGPMGRLLSWLRGIAASTSMSMTSVSEQPGSAGAPESASPIRMGADASYPAAAAAATTTTTTTNNNNNNNNNKNNNNQNSNDITAGPSVTGASVNQSPTYGTEGPAQQQQQQQQQVVVMQSTGGGGDVDADGSNRR